MGTRNLTIVHHEGTYKVAQYGQWDGYPGGQGATILEFMREKFDRDKFIAGLNRAIYPTNEDMKRFYAEAGADPDSEWVTMDVSDRFKAAHPSLDRDMGGEILSYIQDTENPELKLQLGFAGNSLFCEWAYVIDLDTNKLEVFKGFNQTPLVDTERFANVPNLEKTDGYYPICLVASFDLSALPDNETFVNTCDPPESEAEEATGAISL